MKKIFVLTGAGVSAGSGLQTFRATNGLWENFKVEDVATIEGFEKNPELVHGFYNNLRQTMLHAKPNNAHLCLYQLEQKLGKDHLFLVTQNVDLLHEKAGNQDVVHMHGRIDECVCLNCRRISKTLQSINFNDKCPYCGATHTLKPNIVFFGETPMFMDKIEQELQKCDIFMAVGTSGVVYPAAGFVATAKYYGAQTYLFNLEKIQNNPYFDVQIIGDASVSLPDFLTKHFNEICS